MEFERVSCKEWTMDEMKGLNEYSKSLCINSASTNQQTNSKTVSCFRTTRFRA